jgi:hypothetical protein
MSLLDLFRSMIFDRHLPYSWSTIALAVLGALSLLVGGAFVYFGFYLPYRSGFGHLKCKDLL